MLDTNVLLYAEQGASGQAQRLLRRVGNGEVLGVLPQPVWQELSRKLMLAEASTLGIVKGHQLAHQLATKPEGIKELKLYKEKVRALVRLGLKFEPCTSTDFIETSRALQTRHRLMTNDSAIFAVALRIKADVLVTAHKRLHSIKDIAGSSPSDT
ncbi:MAG: hypothetical protein NPIRA02_12860 [Nitrospirales bacterium]|nr:MAG: hypothetical protein NPIRA02_12860 [Nitrospirales bacterium]